MKNIKKTLINCIIKNYKGILNYKNETIYIKDNGILITRIEYDYVEQKLYNNFFKLTEKDELQIIKDWLLHINEIKDFKVEDEKIFEVFIIK